VAQNGYAGQILKINISDGGISKTDTADYADKYIGGHGIAARLYWEMVPADAGAYDAENCLVCASGPVAGFPRFAGFRWKICGKTKQNNPESFSHGNIGERWGAYLKFAGYDALAVQGKAEKSVYIFINGDKVEIRDATGFRGMTSFDTIDALKAELGKNVSVLTIGPAAENLVVFSTVTSDDNTSGSGGMGTVMGSKNLKAIVIAAGDKRPEAADPERLRKLADYIRTLRPPQEDMASPWEIPGLTKAHACYGCGIGCSRQMYPGKDGRRYKSFCQATGVYAGPVQKRYGGFNEAQLFGIQCSDGYGFDSSVFKGLIDWLSACYEKGLISEKETGLKFSELGTVEFMEALSRKIAFREGFGDILAEGTIKAAEEIGGEAEEMLHRFVSTRGGETKDYDPRLMMTSALLYAMEPRRPIQQLHIVATPLFMWLGWGGENKPGKSIPFENYLKTVRNFWGSDIAGDFTTYDGKALAAKKIQDSIYVKESLVLCDLRWPVMSAPGLPGGDPTLESQIYSAITGNELDEAAINKIGERIFNLQRAILLRQGWEGRKSDKILEYYHEVGLPQGEVFYDAGCWVPDKNGEPVSKIGAVVDREKFEQMKSEYYELRGWDVESGLLKKTKLEELQLQDVATDLAVRGLLK
jgi:aldehyde:ferredoxin oxidoreductase